MTNNILKLPVLLMYKPKLMKCELIVSQAFKIFAQQKKYFDKLVEMSILSVAKGNNGSDPLFSLASVVVKRVLRAKGIHRAREIYKR